MQPLLKTYLNSLKVLSSNKKEFYLICIQAIFLAALQFAEPIILGMIVNSLVDTSTNDAASSFQLKMNLLIAWLLISALIVFLNASLTIKSDVLSHTLRLNAITDFFSSAIGEISEKEGAFHSGRLVKIMLQGVDSIYTFAISFFRGHLEVGITLIVLLPFTLLLNPNLGLALIFLVSIFVFITVKTVIKTENLQNDIEELNTKMVEKISDTLGHSQIIKAYGRVFNEIASLRLETRKILSSQKPILSLWALASVLSRSAATIFMAAILIYGVWLNAHDKASVGEIVTFVGFAGLIAGRLDQLSSFVSQLLFQAPSINQYFDIVDGSQNPIRDSVKNTKLSGDILFKNVSAGYHSDKPVLRDLNFKIESGKKIAIVGHTGAGKSTLLNLIYGALTPSSGSISFGDKDYKSLSKSELRANFSIVFQETYLLSRTIEENLRIGKLDASEKELADALKVTSSEFVYQLKDGLKTIVGEHGSTLSGGERQRICLARAFLKNSPVIILDEATSSLDFVTENQIEESLRTISNGKTLIIATHKISQLKEVDSILVLDKGSLVEQGNFHELINIKNGYFSKLYG